MKKRFITTALTTLLIMTMLIGTANTPLNAEVSHQGGWQHAIWNVINQNMNGIVSPSDDVTGEHPPVQKLAPEPLPTIGSIQQLRQWIEKAVEESDHYVGYAGTIESVQALVTQAADGALLASAKSANTTSDYSRTNVQVQGVDEADIVKTDGRYMYQIQSGKIIIVDISDPAEMKIASTVTFDHGESIYPQELYVDGDQMVVIAGRRYVKKVPQPPVPLPKPREPEAGHEAAVDAPAISAAEAAAKKKVTFSADVEVIEGPSIDLPSVILPYEPQHVMTQAIVFDISNRSNPKKIREVEVEGQYLTSRKVENSVYLIANHHMDVYRIQQLPDDELETEAPLYRDSTSNMPQPEPVPIRSIQYFPDAYMTNYMMVAAFDLNEPTQPAQIQTYLGAGQHVYASTEHLYVTVARYHHNDRPANDGEAAQKTLQPMPRFELSTQIFKFTLDTGSTSYFGQGEVPGRLLNQFSMDEHDGYFRLATTTGDMWASDERYISKNHLYVLDDTLKQVGKVEDIAPGERIYSVRFMGDRAYMVTFRNVDPLFVIDLYDPEQPTILGALKIPGYSDYLHPYDENHIIGFGKETVEVMVDKSRDEPTAFYLGMKIALFDVSDVTQPKEKFKTTIGDRGTYSELLNNHKALLFSREKNLLAFPVTLHEVKGEPFNQYGIPSFGEFTFQGLYVYDLSAEHGFQLRGKISHLSQERIDRAGRYSHDYQYNVARALYVGDQLYTLSPAMIQAHQLSSLQESGRLQIP